jgi:thiamine-phosphate pyrophosphorylase
VDPGLLPFRAIAIAESVDAARRIVRSVQGRSDAPALMLRDPRHDPAVVDAMAEELEADLPPELVLIRNDSARPDARWVHLPFAQHARASGLRARGVQVGVSVHSSAELAAVCDVATYLIVSPVFPTRSKPGHAGIGLDGLASLCAQTTLPAFALGGITPGSIGACIEAGAYGVAGITLFEEPATAVAALAELARHPASPSTRA